MGETNVTDRRVERANRTRDSVVDSLLALIDEGNLRPTAREIAARANVSLRSLYVHFDDVEALFHAAALRHVTRSSERIDALPELVVEGSLEARLEAFVTRRACIYESGRNVRRAALLQEPFSPALHSILEEWRKVGRAEIDSVFAPELAGPGALTRRAALDVMTHNVAWEVLRHQHGFTVEASSAATQDMVRALLAQPVEKLTPRTRARHKPRPRGDEAGENPS